MPDERSLYLINAGIDGELDAAEREELEKLLEASAEARKMKSEFQRMANLLDNQAQHQPPADLMGRILNGISLPAEPAGNAWRQWFGSLKPASVGLAFSAGLLAAVTFYELPDRAGIAPDASSMVGTMVAGEHGRQKQLDSLSIQEADLSGRVSLYREKQVLVLSFELDSRELVEVEISYAEAGLHFGGLANSYPGDKHGSDSYVISGGAVRVSNQGRQAFSVFLPPEAGTDGRGRTIDIAIYSKGTKLFTGAIQG